ncbi:MAG TPA: di-trans,poly-cis-decaprenylcistransferase [Bryobacteraceae bacterium]|nr:di-trans,poly-cis-decaprenylcistransferase [Bryobacteraceae bacterium]
MPQLFILQSTFHTALIMDGNGRWAAARGLPRIAGHRAGAQTAQRVVEAAPDLGISVLTLFTFSSDNWRRPPEEIRTVMSLLAEYLEKEAARCREHGVRLEVIGRRDRLDPALRAGIARAEQRTASGSRLWLRLAVDYSGRDAILAAAGRVLELSRDSIGGVLGPPVDLLIRTGGERRLSDFLLWESAYAELVFSQRMWPDFGAEELAGAVREFRLRERRFGGVPAPPIHGRHSATGETPWLE